MANAVSMHTRKFGAAYFALAAILGTAIGTFVLLVERPAPPPPPPWSLWKPTAAAPMERATEIAEYVGAQYHLPSGKRLVSVDVGQPVPSSDPIQAVFVAKTRNPATQNDVDQIPAADAMMFTLCGAGKDCSIKEGKPSEARAAVLRREALELALYTFRYVDVANSVVTFFPPPPGEKLTLALYFSRSDFGDELDRPLRNTLPHIRPPLPTRLPQDERKTIDQLTTDRVFSFSLPRAKTGERVLLLEPVRVS